MHHALPAAARRFAALLVAALASAACTTLPGPAGQFAAPLLRDGEGCQAWLAALDAAIAAAGVADAEAERIPGVSGLRVDRIGQALSRPAAQDDAAWHAWLERAAQLDQHARRAEIENLPATALPIEARATATAASAASLRGAAHARTDACRERTVAQLQAGSAPREWRAAIAEAAVVPERYSTALRALGAYPLVRWPFFAGVQGWQEGHAATMQRWAEAPPTALQRHELGPEGQGKAATRGAPALRPQPDALGLPQLTPAGAQRLLAWHAPVFEIEELGVFDRFGVPVLAAAGDPAAPQVDTTQPVVYTRLTHTRFEGRWLLQLVYTLWFPERPARSNFDLLAGALDGVIVRLTLAENGEPLLMDTIHACGCYHLVFPSAALHARAEAPRSQEWMFAPAALPAGVGRDARLVVRLASGTHYVSGLAAAPRGSSAGAPAAPAATSVRYTLRDEGELRSLPLAPAPQAHSPTAPQAHSPPAPRRSLYGPDGLVAGSERGERFLFWPMGIASAGAMRQWGHHATAFVGRRHFDEVDLIERRFQRAAPAPRPEP
jgi:hypothetical protein